MFLRAAFGLRPGTAYWVGHRSKQCARRYSVEGALVCNQRLFKYAWLCIPSMAMGVGVTSQFMPLRDKALDISGFKEASGRCVGTHQTQGSVVSAQHTVLPQDLAADRQGGDGKIIERK